MNVNMEALIRQAAMQLGEWLVAFGVPDEEAKRVMGSPEGARVLWMAAASANGQGSDETSVTGAVAKELLATWRRNNRGIRSHVPTSPDGTLVGVLPPEGWPLLAPSVSDDVQMLDWKVKPLCILSTSGGSAVGVLHTYEEIRELIDDTSPWEYVELLRVDTDGEVREFQLQRHHIAGFERPYAKQMPKHWGGEAE